MASAIGGFSAPDWQSFNNQQAYRRAVANNAIADLNSMNAALIGGTNPLGNGDAILGGLGLDTASTVKQINGLKAKHKSETVKMTNLDSIGVDSNKARAKASTGLGSLLNLTA